ncbi:MAG: hypothetical protein HQ538_00670 [Parcubacteria group bacterium]|nr:hypothetical protein [Parcubacteria group bacterium]
MIIYCNECAKRYLCKKIEESFETECAEFKEDLDFLKETKEELLDSLDDIKKRELERKQKKIIKKRAKLKWE